MQAASSANRTCSESRSTSLWTATVFIPISLQVQMMRQAISPRLAIRIFLNLRGLKAIRNFCHKEAQEAQKNGFVLPVLLCGLTLNTEQRLPVLYRLSVLDVDLDHFSRRFRLNLVHEFHGFDDAHDRCRLDVAADLHKRIGARRWR